MGQSAVGQSLHLSGVVRVAVLRRFGSPPPGRRENNAGYERVTAAVPGRQRAVPGQPRALCAFAKRHQGLIHDLVNGPLPLSMAVVAIHEGSERDPGPVHSVHEIGCTATLRTGRAAADGRFVLVTAGAQRLQLISVDQARSYPRARVAVLYEDTGDQAAAALMATAVQHAYRAYVHATAGPATTALNLPDLPGDPVELSYNVADLIVLGKPARQALLAEPDALSRLIAEHTLLTRETALARTLGSPLPRTSGTPSPAPTEHLIAAPRHQALPGGSRCTCAVNTRRPSSVTCAIAPA